MRGAVRQRTFPPVRDATIRRSTSALPALVRTAWILTLLVLVLAAVASAGGIFIPGLYRFASWLVPATEGQDLVTLLSLPVLFVAMQAARRGSLRATLTWLGLLGYVGYTYTGAAFAYGMGPFFLLYVALFGLTVFALVSTAGTLRMAEVVGRFDEGVPRRSVAGFLLGMAFLLCLLWLAQILPNLRAHPVPERVETFKFVHALDLGLVVPLMVTGAVGLLRRTPLGFVVSGCMLR